MTARLVPALAIYADDRDSPPAEHERDDFCEIHQSLRISPVMEAGITNHVRSLQEVIGLLGQGDPKLTTRQSA